MYPLTLLSIAFLIVDLLVLIYVYGMLRARFVPFVKTRQPVYNELIKHLQLQPGQTFVELGSGDAEVLSSVTQAFPGIRARGYEIAVIPYWFGRFRQRRDDNRYRLLRRSFFGADLSDADALYCFLMPHRMAAVWQKVSRTCRPGTRLYSYAFSVPNVSPTATYQPADQNQIGKRFGKLYEYRV